MHSDTQRGNIEFTTVIFYRVYQSSFGDFNLLDGMLAAQYVALLKDTLQMQYSIRLHAYNSSIN